ncbi:MAG: BlaI/MecI/CopY family transcriptional regulator [Planctomycetota bacterium]
MEKKGLIRHTSRGVAHVYSPAVSKKKIIRPFIHKVVNEVFGGKPSAMMQALLTEAPVSDDELARIHKLLEQAKTPRPQKGRRK